MEDLQNIWLFTESLKIQYRTMFGDFETDDYTGCDWLFFGIGSFLMTVVMMNLLIAIIGDEFEKVMTSIVTSQYKQLCDLVLELETFYISNNWNNKDPYQFLLCAEYI